MDILVSNVKNLKIYDNTLFHLEDTKEKYKEYIDKLLTLEPKKIKYFLLNLKNREIINNQEAELEQSFLLELFKLTQRQDSIDITMQHFEDDNVDKTELKKIHRIVIKGSSDDISANYEYRRDNNKWVGHYGTNGVQRVDYYPPDYNEISELMDITLDYLNKQNDRNDEFNDIFIKPFIVHALIAYIQPFGNGNTRLARVIQHGKICKMTNEIYNTEFATPAMYLSKNYLLTRNQYRGIIKEIAVNKDSDSWNKWFNYNLNMIDEQVYYLDTQVTAYQKTR